MGRPRNEARDAAIAAGLKKYPSDTTCKYGHKGYRYVTNHQCVECGDAPRARKYTMQWKRDHRFYIGPLPGDWAPPETEDYDPPHKIRTGRYLGIDYRVSVVKTNQVWEAWTADGVRVWDTTKTKTIATLKRAMDLRAKGEAA